MPFLGQGVEPDGIFMDPVEEVGAYYFSASLISQGMGSRKSAQVGCSVGKSLARQYCVGDGHSAWLCLPEGESPCGWCSQVTEGSSGGGSSWHNLDEKAAETMMVNSQDC